MMSPRSHQAIRAAVVSLGTLIGGSHRSALAQPVVSQWNGIYTVEQAKRGETLYAQNCAVCHSAEMDGTILAPPLKGPVFDVKWNQRSLAAMFDLIQLTMPLNMMTHLGAQQNADVLAFMLQKANVPPGRQELSARAEALQSIKFLGSKP